MKTERPHISDAISSLLSAKVLHPQLHPRLDDLSTVHPPPRPAPPRRNQPDVPEVILKFKFPKLGERIPGNQNGKAVTATFSEQIELCAVLGVFDQDFAPFSWCLREMKQTLSKLPSIF